MTHCTICGDPCPGADWRDQAWCAACFADHIARGTPWAQREAPAMAVPTALQPGQQARLDAWLQALGVATGEEDA